MGHIHVEATIKAERSARVRFLVDTGATHSLVSRELAQRIGMNPGRVRDRVRLATGEVVRLPVAAAIVCIADREASATFWIGPCDEPLLGAETLEVLGLTLDPVKGRLRPTRPWATRLGGLAHRRRATPSRAPAAAPV